MSDYNKLDKGNKVGKNVHFVWVGKLECQCYNVNVSTHK